MRPFWAEYKKTLSTTHKYSDFLGSIKLFLLYYPKPVKSLVYDVFISNLVGSIVDFLK